MFTSDDRCLSLLSFGSGARDREEALHDNLPGALGGDVLRISRASSDTPVCRNVHNKSNVRETVESTQSTKHENLLVAVVPAAKEE